MTVLLSVILTVWSIVAALSPIFIIVSIIGIVRKEITLFEIITFLFSIPLAIFFWGPVFVSTLAFPFWFEIVAFIGLILLTVDIIKNNKKKEIA